MITINENKELIDLQKKLRGNGYREDFGECFEKSYQVGKSWKNVKLKMVRV